MTPDTAEAAVQLALMPAFFIMGLSHIVRPVMWVEFFRGLNAQGTSGLVLKIFALEVWPAFAIVGLHQVWSGPGLIITLYGWALAFKCTLSLLVPDIGMRSMAMAERGPRNFVIAGFVLIGLGCICLWALLGNGG